MSISIEQLNAELVDCRGQVERYRLQIQGLEGRRDELMKEVDTLEVEVVRLEAEGLQPVVDRLRAQITSIKKLVAAMATAIEELT